MSAVASKNLFDLLGNDPDEEPQAPVQPVDKAQPRTGKRNTPAEAPAKEPRGAATGGRGGRGGRRDNFTGSEQAFQDRDAGRNANQGKPIDDNVRADRHAHRSEGGRGRGPRPDRGGRAGGRGGRGGGGRDDRHSRTGIGESAKQTAMGWGEESGQAEWRDEKEGQAIALEEEKKGFDSNPADPVSADGEKLVTQEGDAPEPEPEDKSRSYEDYLAEQAEKKLQLGGSLTARKPNEGSAKKQPEGKAYTRETDEYFIGGGGKQKRERERKEKNTLVLDHDMLARERETAGRGGRGGRGRGRGEGGLRGEGGFRGEGRGRGGGGGGGGRGRGDFRGDSRGGRGGRGGNSPNVSDQSAFPTLGA